jgi:tetratricopeptide (TPR) repeat protein
MLQRLGRTELEAARRSPEGQAAVERFEQMARRSPESGEDFYHSGKELLRLGRYDLAERAFRLSARRGHRIGASLYNAACALSLEGRRAEALDLLQQALEAGFDDPKLIRTDEDLEPIRSEPGFRELVVMADALELRADGKSFLGMDRGRDREAWQRVAARYEEYAGAHPRLGRAWFNMGCAKLAAGDAAAATRAFEKSVALDYRRSTSLYDLACSYARLGRKDDAFRALFESLDAGFDQPGTIADDEDLDSLHGDPRFQKVLRASREARRASR